ncbi:MAG: copper amine oxidase N-terminal domain-containing protein, partial [Gorillibacterium sp.]|nr:copper amine oxidase N-terminal domain-containing protein [Gorillibacterium sp.]
MVPIKPIFQELGLGLTFNQKTNVVVGTKTGMKITLTIGSTKAVVNGKAVTLSLAPKIIKGATYVPLRFIG